MNISSEQRKELKKLVKAWAENEEIQYKIRDKWKSIPLFLDDPTPPDFFYHLTQRNWRIKPATPDELFINIYDSEIVGHRTKPLADERAEKNVIEKAVRYIRAGSMPPSQLPEDEESDWFVCNGDEKHDRPVHSDRKVEAIFRDGTPGWPLGSAMLRFGWEGSDSDIMEWRYVK